ncbi:SDR family NAD(P)-dependent oxidoreductase [Pseudonocardia sp. TMWB2A]|uniref:hypothetical protein n=1 Tax=Pseudonocardia sp. TMWB2A TaxID=687430 RepID=UPI00307DE3AD
MSRLLIFGPGYSGRRIAALAEARGWDIDFVDRPRFDDMESVRASIRQATHILSTVPPLGAHDPVLTLYGEAIALAPAYWVGYLSSTGVYGDARGGWCDESTPLDGQRSARVRADRAWAALREEVRIFRLPGIYGSGRSVIDKLKDGTAHRIDAPGHIFSRIHVDDLARGVVASFAGPSGVYHLADDHPAPQSDVIAYGAALLGIEAPLPEPLESAPLTPMARSFYAASRRIANGKARRILGWRPRYRSYREGLMTCL